MRKRNHKKFEKSFGGPKKYEQQKGHSGGKKARFFCKLHGPNMSHDTAQCKVLNNGDKPKTFQKNNRFKKGYEKKEVQVI